jgi:hypothetical protein
VNPDRKQIKEEKKEKKKARKEIDALFKLIKAGCDKLEKFDILMEKARKIQPVLERYREILNAGLVQDVENAIQKIDQTRKEVHQFCDLADRLQALTNTLYDPAIPHWAQDLLPAAGGGGVLAGVVTALVIVSAVITAFSPLGQASIDVTNHGCDPIAAPKDLPNIPGVSFWTKPIPDGGHGLAKILPFIQIGVDATQANVIGISLFNIGPIPLPMSGVKSIALNGKEIIGQVVSETLGIKANYSLVISCR